MAAQPTILHEIIKYGWESKCTARYECSRHGIDSIWAIEEGAGGNTITKIGTIEIKKAHFAECFKE